MAVGPDGNVYVASLGLDTISVFSPDGTFLKNFATGLHGPDTLLFIGNQLYVSVEGSTAMGDCSIQFLNDPSQVVVFDDYTDPNSKRVFAPQPVAFPAFDFVSFWGISRGPGKDQKQIVTSDFAGGLRTYKIRGDGTPTATSTIGDSSNFVGDVEIDKATGDVFSVGFDRTTLDSFVVKYAGRDLSQPPTYLLAETPAVQRAIGELLTRGN